MNTTNSNTNSVRVSGNMTPAYLNGRSREMLIAAFQPSPRAEVPTLAAMLRNSGARIGDGVPFAALYMTRASKKQQFLPRAA